MPVEEQPNNRSNSLRRRGPSPDFGEVALGDTFLVVVEGDVTERLYFEGIRGCLALGSVQVQVVSPGHRDPVGLIEEAKAKRDDPKRRRAEGRASIREPEAYDHVWVVFDWDPSAERNMLTKALKLAESEAIRVAFSTPSIEFWLLLHFRFTTGPLLNSAAAERAVGATWGQRYDKRTTTFAKLWQALKPNVSAATNRAMQVRAHHEASDSTVPPNPTTYIDLLVRALNASVQPPRRILC